MSLTLILTAVASLLGGKKVYDEINDTRSENCDHFYSGPNHVCMNCGKQDSYFQEHND